MLHPVRYLFALLLFTLLTPLARAEVITGKVVAVADGDTITVLQDETQVKVRFHGIDCPESRQDFGTAAKDFTADHCFGEEVTVVVTDTDRYSRKVGLVILKDGRVLNHDLVAAGYAWHYAEYAPKDETLKRLQEEAKTAKRGLWSRADAIAPSEFRKDKVAERAAPYNPPSTISTPPSQAGGGTGQIYLSETGTKFHRKDCRTLKGSSKGISREGAEQQGFSACKVCKP